MNVPLGYCVKRHVVSNTKYFTKVKNNRTINLTVAGHQEDIITPSFIGLTLKGLIKKVNLAGIFFFLFNLKI